MLVQIGLVVSDHLILSRKYSASSFVVLLYDQADQLRNAILKNATSGATTHDYAYNYDDAGNRTSDQIDSTPRTFASNHLNQVTSQTTDGPMRFSGTLSKPGSRAHQRAAHQRGLAGMALR